ncbi:hypothetical protein SAMN05421493_1188 [Pseudobutyrivibrio sp. 49]|uniref:hypothetical protein n=1 Tax=Pseudobutyrivibrio sp. 49 TaxID=1855344 RepID=UPI00087E33A7|nr:hypothetical protein [Pseudobutyrivibrio sp. 49]SDI55820.1 hypothetical protein SAMN05421493_1188 [Pseudobutyrivibrio sp. 49]
MTIIEALDLTTEKPMEGAVAFLNVISSGNKALEELSTAGKSDTVIVSMKNKLTPEQNLVFDALLSSIRNSPTCRTYKIRAIDCKELVSVEKRIVIDSVFSREDDMDERCIINVEYIHEDEIESIKIPWSHCFYKDYDNKKIIVAPTDLFKQLVLLSSIDSCIAC